MEEHRFNTEDGGKEGDFNNTVVERTVQEVA